MKKLYLLGLSICLISMSLLAQNKRFTNFDNQRPKQEVFEDFPVLPQQSYVKRTGSAPYGTVVGTSTYDLQNNYSVGNTRIHQYPNGEITTVWTQSVDANGGHPDRGTGYNVYDPNSSAWGTPTTLQHGINQVRTGWPMLAPLDNGELVLSHDFAQNYMIAARRNNTGSGIWTEAPVGFSGVWGRAATVSDTVHMITVNNNPSFFINGIGIPLEYHRSDDGGQSWAISSYSNFPGYDTTTFWFANIGADGYAIDAYDNYVAIVVGGGWDPLVLYKSDNYGADGSWTQRIIFQQDSSYSSFDSAGLIHAVPSVSEDVSLVLDDTGGVHISTTGFAVRWDRGQNKPQDPNGGRFFYPDLCAGIYYWNESMPDMDYVINPFVTEAPAPGNVWNPIAMYFDYTQDSVYNVTTTDSIGTYNGGLAGHSTISIDNNGGVYIAWSQVAEELQPLFANYFRDIYFAYSFDGGSTWGDIVSVGGIEVGDDGLTGGTLAEEDVYPTTPKRVGSDDLLHIMFQSDMEAGVHVNGTAHAITTNDMTYYPLDISQFRPTAIENIVEEDADFKVFPNPAEEEFYISLKGNKDEIRITDLMGRTLNAVNFELIENGLYRVNSSEITPGIYLLHTTENGTRASQKIVIK